MLIAKYFTAGLLGLALVGPNVTYGCGCGCCCRVIVPAPAANAPAGQDMPMANPMRMANTMQMTLAVTGMSCANCAAKVKKSLLAVPGVSQVTVNVETGKAVVTVEMAKCDEKALVKAVEKVGYGAKVVK